MTYCLAIRLDAGFVVGSDSRTNAGVDYVTSYSKMHSFQPAPDRVFTILSAGSLATTQQVLFHVQRDLDDPGSTRNLRTVSYLFEAAEYLGETSARVQDLHRDNLSHSGVRGETTLILAGQVGSDPPEIFLIYPQGNFITASDATPYLQIGETKYGKPVLDRLVHAAQPLSLAARVALLSLDSSARSNLSVAPPFEIGIYDAGSLALPEHFSLDGDSPEVLHARAAMDAAVATALEQLDSFPHE